MNQMIENIKQIHYNDLCLFRMGGFFHAYSKDAYILSYLFGYKMQDLGNNVYECGFPINSLPKIMAKLENNKINYVVIDRRNNYDVEDKTNYKNLNRYEKFVEKAKVYVNSKKRIDKIYKFLMDNIYKEDIKIKIINIERMLKNARNKI